MGRITININTNSEGNHQSKGKIVKWACPVCKGTGKFWHYLYGDQVCKPCGGQGYFVRRATPSNPITNCTNCGGSGQVETLTSDVLTCKICRGAGKSGGISA